MTNQLISPLSWQSVSLTHPGKVRSVNEDSFMSNDIEAHWAVADGMGGHAAGDVASQEIVAALRVLKQGKQFADFIDAIEESLIAVNNKLIKMAEAEDQLIGSTIVGMTVRQKKAFMYWAGDSRVYLFRDQKLSQISIDHTMVQELVIRGEITEEEARNHPEKNVITRAIGSDEPLFVEFCSTEILPGDIYFVCSDGVEKELSDQEVENCFNSGSELDVVAEDILTKVLDRGARDNVTLIAIQFSE